MENILSERVEKVLKKIRETRKLNGLSHENMAHELDISPSAYNKMERSETMLSLDRLLKISEILNIPLADVFDIKTGDTLHQDLKDNAIGKVEHLQQENKERIAQLVALYEKRIEEKDDLISYLKLQLEKASK